MTTDLLAALWKAIRDFEPDYLFCPPLPSDPLAGVHVDHLAVAQAVREVAYMINVPHAFTPEYPADETQSQPVKVPVILHTYDTYQFGMNSHDLALNVEAAWPVIVDETECHPLWRMKASRTDDGKMLLEAQQLPDPNVEQISLLAEKLEGTMSSLEDALDGTDLKEYSPAYVQMRLMPLVVRADTGYWVDAAVHKLQQQKPSENN